MGGEGQKKYVKARKRDEMVGAGRGGWRLECWGRKRPGEEGGGSRVWRDIYANIELGA